MLFRNRESERGSQTIRVARDTIEIFAILAAGFWAFYVFVYENRIKPSFTDPQVSVGARLRETSHRSGAIGVLLTTEVHNEGSVRVYFAGYGVTVLGTRMSLSTHPLPPRPNTSQDTNTFFSLSQPVAVYGFAVITTLGNPNSKHDMELEPGGSVEQEHTFFIPEGRFDVLTARVEGCLAKSEDRTIPSQLIARKNGATGVTCGGGTHLSYDVGSLDLRH
ncbi:MAG: hypothetical protein WAK16_03440 [Candidatus Cybelea sp.]|jgi:hypothetical protein